MNLRQQIRKERKAYFANATTKEKFNYIWEYYGLWISVGLILIGIIIYIIIRSVTAPEDILNGTFANSYSNENSYAVSDLGDAYMKDRNIDTSKRTVSFNGGLSLDSYEGSTILITQVTGEKLDFVVGTETDLAHLAYGELFADLSDVLSKEQYEYYKPYFLYVDGAVIKEQQNIEAIDDSTVIEFPDATKPEEMEDPIPVYIDLSSSDKLENLYGNLKDDMVFVIAFNAPNMKQTLDFLDYLMR